MESVSDVTPRILRDIQQSLVDITSQIDLDRRNTRSLYDNLSIEIGRRIGALDARIELVAERVEAVVERLETMVEQLQRIEKLLTKPDGEASRQ